MFCFWAARKNDCFDCLLEFFSRFTLENFRKKCNVQIGISLFVQHVKKSLKESTLLKTLKSHRFQENENDCFNKQPFFLLPEANSHFFLLLVENIHFSSNGFRVHFFLLLVENIRFVFPMV